MIELFAQHDWHADGAIRLNAAGARTLLAQLQAFLEGRSNRVQVFASDGEGYHLNLVAGDLHDDASVNHYLDIPGIETDSADTLLAKVAKNR